MAKLCGTESIVAIGSLDVVKIFSLENGQCLFTYNHDFDKSIKDGMNKALDKRLEDLCCTEKYVCAIYSDKRIVILQSLSTGWSKADNGIKVRRRPTAMRFDQTGNALLVADKSGDLYRYNIHMELEKVNSEFDETEIEPILGHVSMLLDVNVSYDDQYIISADRDEKIRISQWQNPYVIEAFCLGHTEFVCAVEPVNDSIKTLFLSTSGDGSIRLWNAITGEEIFKYVFEEPPSENLNSSSNFRFVPSILTCNVYGYFAVASSHINMAKPSMFMINSGSSSFELLQDLKIPNCVKVHDMKFVKEDTVLILYSLTVPEKDNQLALHAFVFEGECFHSKCSEALNSISANLESLCSEHEDMYENLFKMRCEGEVYGSYQKKKEERLLKLKNKLANSTNESDSKRVKVNDE